MSRRLRVVAACSVTLACMFLGFLSLTFSIKGGFMTAAWLIIAAGALDVMDGPLARTLRASTDFGREFDSFADLVSFGLAPSLLFYHAYFLHWGLGGVLLSFLPTVMASLRLTRYNISTAAERRDYFSGLASTAGANLLASYILFSHDVWPGHLYPNVAAGLLVVCSILMVSRFRYSTAARLLSGGLWRTPKGALFVFLGTSFALFPEKTIFPAMSAVALEGLLSRPIGHAVHQVHSFRRHHFGA